ncbi:MAG: DNA-processing protein DprA [Lysobacter sp.]
MQTLPPRSNGNDEPTRDRDALLRLIACTGLAAPRRRLLEQAAPAAALAAGASLWRACGLTSQQVTALHSPSPVVLERAHQWLSQPHHHLIGWHDPDYPPLLRHTQNPPLALFVAGDPALLWRPAVALVGSRSPTPGGRDNAAEFARVFAIQGLAVASGLAAGIDTAAHHASLAVDGITVAVLGTGPDVPYPRSNTALHARIIEHGAVISEHLPGTGPRREHFPSRNRILAGLSLGTLVIEAAHRSGALITARLAGECGREVMALPGSIHNPLARGCHRLIRDGACLVECPQDALDLLAAAVAEQARDLRQRLAAPTSGSRSPLGESPDTRNRHPAPTGVAPLLPAQSPAPTRREHPHEQISEHQTLWHALGHDPTGMDELVARTGLTPAQLSSMLLPMELEGRVVAQHGRYYRNR